MFSKGAIGIGAGATAMGSHRGRGVGLHSEYNKGKWDL